MKPGYQDVVLSAEPQVLTPYKSTKPSAKEEPNQIDLKAKLIHGLLARKTTSLKNS